MTSIMSGMGAACYRKQWKWRCGAACYALLVENAKKRSFFSCRASCRSSENQQRYDYDLYELLGVERNASLPEIRKSYRWLQKKCHPDIAGLVGHDMSILLNQAYTTLADPHQRAVYDQSLADSAQLHGYTGCPLYSKWFGPPHEERAVFVDESHCVGCLKCALIAPNTFAIENRFGRARAVGQWADPQPLIEDAIKACPVDCITWVDRCKLAAFEFVMSREPRFPVSADVHSNGGVVFKGVERLLEKLKQQEENRTSNATETPAQRKARLAAMEGVHARSGRWWYYFVGNPDARDQTAPSLNRKAHGAIVPLGFYSGVRNQKYSEFCVRNQKYSDFSAKHTGDGYYGDDFKFQGELHRLFEAATKQRQGQASPGGGAFDDEYWVPISRTSHLVSYSDGSQPVMSAEGAGFEKGKRSTNRSGLEQKMSGWAHGVTSGGPVLTAAVAAWFVGVTGGPGVALTDAEVGVGPIPMDWMQSVELQILFVAAVWYLIGAVLANASVLAVSLLRGRGNGSTPPCA